MGGRIDAAEALRVALGILAGGDLHCGDHLDAGWGIRAGGAISTGGSVRAGEGVECAGEITAGQGYGIHAGLSVRRDVWHVSAPVRASRRPQGLVSGWWAGEAADRAAPPGIEPSVALDFR